MREMPAGWVARKAQLEERLAKQDARIAARIKLRDEIEARGEDAPAHLSEEIGALLKSSADTVEHMKDLDRESVILAFEQEDREKATAFKPREKREGDLAVALDAPAGLESKELEEIVFVLRTKQKWTWQNIVDWLVAKGVTKKRGGSNWHTSDVYAIHKKGFKSTAA